MKTIVKLGLLFIITAVVVFAVYIVRQASSPESAIIAGERDSLAAQQDTDRMEKDPIYAIDSENKLSMLDFRLAEAYNREKKPEQAILVLQRLIGEEEAKGRRGIPRQSRSYLKQARYYETLHESYNLKGDQAAGMKALSTREQLMAKATALRKSETTEEGRSVLPPD